MTHDGPPTPWHARWPPDVILVLAAAIMILLAAPLNTDSGWYLIGARRLMGGERLYVDLVEVNPPLIFWMFVPSAVLGERFPISDDVLVSLGVAAILALSTLVAWRALGLEGGASRVTRSALLWAFLLSVVTLFLFGVGQREQICAILFFPYALLAARAASRLDTPRWLSIAGGILAGLGIALKPFFLAPWIAVELVVILARRQRFPFLRTASSIALFVQCLYVIAVVVATPAYISGAVPLARATYWAYGVGKSALLSSRLVLALLSCVIGAFTIPFVLRPQRSQLLAHVFAAATLGFVISYVVQSRGFWYHPIPAQVFAILSAIATIEVVATALLTNNRGWRRIAAAISALAILFAAILSLPVGVQLSRNVRTVVRSRYPPVITALTDAVRQSAVGEPVYFLSTSVWPAFPVVNLAGATWPYHYNCLWPLPALYRGRRGTEPQYRNPEEQGRIERAFFDTVVNDLTTHPPRLLIVEHGTGMQAMRGQEFDFVRYFSASPEFATLFRRYHRLGNIASWELFERW